MQHNRYREDDCNMKLSLAIERGNTMKRHDPRVFLSPDGKCGCAFGGALLAAGVTVEEWRQDFDNSSFIEDLLCVRARWPWLTAEHITRIGDMYFEVCAGKREMGEIVEWVRGVEPTDNADPGRLNIPGVREVTVEEFAAALCE